MKRNQILYLAGGLIILVAILRLCSHHEEEPKFTPRDYPEIIESGILRAVTEYNTISYHADKDSLSGFDYELLNAFAQAKNLRLEVTPEMSFEERLKGLNKGKYDLIATETTVTTQPHSAAQQAGTGTAQTRKRERQSVHTQPTGVRTQNPACGQRLSCPAAPAQPHQRDSRHHLYSGDRTIRS